MTALTSPRGPLPARVYWFRRLMVLSILFVLVFGTTRFLVGEGDPTPGTERAATVAAPVQDSPEKTAQKAGEKAARAGAEAGSPAVAGDATTAPAGPQPSTAPSVQPSATPTPTPTETPKPTPTGACANADVAVVPTVAGPRTSLKVAVSLTLRTRTAPACTWEISPRTVVVKIDSGPRERPDDIWSSAQCPKAVQTQKVTLYKDHDTVVPVVWNGRRSNSTCSDNTPWAKRGWYHVKAASYGGEPASKQFELTRPSPVTVTRTVAPKPVKTTAPTKTPASTTPAAPATSTPQQAGTPKPSGAVEPDLD